MSRSVIGSASQRAVDTRKTRVYLARARCAQNVAVGQRTVLYLEPKRASTTVASVFMVLVMAALAVAAVVYTTDRWPDRWRPTSFEISRRTCFLVAAGAAVLMLAFAVGAVVNGRRWHTARQVERMSNDPTLGAMLPETMVLPPPAPAVVPPPQIEFVKAQSLPRPRERLRRVTRDANVIGRPPLQIAFLRVFENQPRMRTFIEGAWREFGYVYFLRSAAAVTPAELRTVQHSTGVASLFVTTEPRLLNEIGGRSEEPNDKGRYRFTRIAATTIRVRDRYGSYPIRPVLCHGTYWRSAVDTILERTDLVVLDLSGYTDKHAGTRYELQRVVDRVPVERVVFLADGRSSRRVLRRELNAAWAQMSPRSPNATVQPKRVIVAITDYYQRSQSQAANGQTTEVHVRLVARRSQTRRLAAMAQHRVETYRAG
jgi:hypothetical protein